ncbi:MAG: FliA/WhiG family RNA polymerase sigma factor [Bacillota bacterium]
MTESIYDHLGDAAQYWKAYKETGDWEARENLILEYVGLVKHVSGQMAMGMPAEIQPSDLETYGIFGLIDALDKFDVTKRIKFETYAVMRIRGAILDGVRKMDWVPASLRRRWREIRDARDTLRKSLRRQPTEGEVALYLDNDPEKLRNDSIQIAKMKMVYLDEAYASEDMANVDALLNSIPDERTPDPFEHASWQAQRDRIAQAIGKLNEQEQTVITLYYYEGLTLGEIAETMGLSPSRISQVHTTAVRRMRQELNAEKEFLMAMSR